MIINIAAVAEGYSEVLLTISDADRPENWPNLAGPLLCECKINRHGRDLTIEIAFSGWVRHQCARCLEPFRQEVHGETVVVLQPNDPSQPEELDEDHSVFYYNDQKPEVDLSPAIFDELMIAQPIMPLCSPDCPGVQFDEQNVKGPKKPVPKSTEIDPRWEALKKLRPKNTSNL